jgi:hypothetical protein
MLTIVLFIILCILQINDIGSTYYLLSRGYKEANPVMRWLIKQLGLGHALIWPKVIVMIGLWFWMNAYVLAVLCGLYAWVVWRNFEVVSRLADK